MLQVLVCRSLAQAGLLNSMPLEDLKAYGLWHEIATGFEIIVASSLVGELLLVLGTDLPAFAWQCCASCR